MKRRAIASVFGVVLSFASASRADDRVAACADAAERGQVLRDGRSLVEARALFVSCAQRECPAAVRDSCTEWLSDVDRRLPSIVVAVKDASGRDVSGFNASLDGSRLPEEIAAQAARVNPGTHTLVVEAADYEPVSREVVVREGEPVQVVTVTLQKRQDAAPAPKPRGVPVLPIVLGGTAVVALGLFGYFGLRGAADYRELERTCSPNCAKSEIDSVRTTFIAADITLVVGIAASVAAGALLLFDHPPSNRRASR